MKTLYLVRHAKASWKHDVEDHERPLKKRGHKDSKLVSEEVKSKIDFPEKIYASDAVRALSTAEFFKDAMDVADSDFEAKHILYDFRGANTMRFIKELDNALDRVMIVGHNHAFTSIVNMMGDKYIENLPTCGFAMLEFDEDHWGDITTGKTVCTIFPRDLKS